jgi:hypothetical protein
MPNLQPYYPMIFAVFVIIAIIVAGLIMLKNVRKNVRGRRGSRLGISEFHELDKTRRLVLVRRDNVEHLVLIGGLQDLVIESGIDSGINTSSLQVATEPTQMRVAPRPAVFGNRRPPLRPITPIFGEEESNDRAS